MAQTFALGAELDFISVKFYVRYFDFKFMYHNQILYKPKPEQFMQPQVCNLPLLI